MTSCPYCATYGPSTHSFNEIANTPKFGKIIYTSVAKANDYSNTKAISAHVVSVMEKSGIPPQQWSWIFDCKDMKMKHTLQIDVAISLAKMFRDRYTEQLIMIYIINPTPGIDALVSRILPFLHKDSHKYVRKIPGSVLQLYEGLKAEGFEEEALRAIMNATQS